MDLRHTVTTHYTQTDEEARECYSAGRPGWETGTPAEFDRFLTRIRCDAYDEGYEDGQHDAHEHRPWRKSTHPYRQEQTP